MIDCSCDRLSSGSFQCVRCLQSKNKTNLLHYPNLLFLLMDLRQAYLVGVHNCKQAGWEELQTKENYGTLLSILYCVLLFIFVILNIQSDHHTIYAAADFAWSRQLETVSYWKLQDVFKTRMICKNSLSFKPDHDFLNSICFDRKEK